MTLVTMRTRAILTPIRGCRARRGVMHPYRPYLHKKKPRLSAETLAGAMTEHTWTGGAWQ